MKQEFNNYKELKAKIISKPSVLTNSLKKSSNIFVYSIV